MSDNETIAEDTTQAVDVSAKIDIKIEDLKAALPVDVEKNKASESAVAGGSKGVGPIVSDDNKAVDAVVSVGSKTVEPIVSNEGKDVESVVAGDSKAVKSEITVDTKTVEPIVVDAESNMESPSCFKLLCRSLCRIITSKPQICDGSSLDSSVSDSKDSSAEMLEDGAGYFENTFIGPVVSIPPQNEINYATLVEEKIIPAYLGDHTCNNAIPKSGNVLILSVELLVKDAFSALEKNVTKAAVLWDAEYYDLVGMLTISDFINVLRHYYRSSPEDIKGIENQSISTWRRITNVGKRLVKVNVSDSLLQATELLFHEGVHRIPVFDQKRQLVLFMLTRRKLLHFLGNILLGQIEKTPSFFRKTIQELEVGTFKDIATVKASTKLIDALDLFVNRKVSSLPVVDENNEFEELFDKLDVFKLVKDKAYHNLDMSMEEAIDKAGVGEQTFICTLDNTFETVIAAFVIDKARRIVVTKSDENGEVVGMISISDVLKFFVLNPPDNSGLPSTTETIEDDSEGAVGGTIPEPSTSLDTTQKETTSMKNQ